MKRILSLLFCSFFLFSLCACVRCEHDFGEWSVVVAATCSKKGVDRRVCLNCGKEEEKKTDALGHDFDPAFSVDVAPTIEQEGLRSRHCKRSGCDERTDLEVMKKLQSSSPENNQGNNQNNQGNDPAKDPSTNPGDPAKDPEKEPEKEPGFSDPLPPPNLYEYPIDDEITGEAVDGKVTYRIRVNRYNGRKIGYPLPFVKVSNMRGDVVYDGIVPLWDVPLSQESELSMLDLTLEKGTYKVVPYNIPDGFVNEAPYFMDEEHPVLDIRMRCHPTDNPLGRVEVGYVMPDITLKSVNKGDVKLNKLLSETQILVLCFFRNSCYWCQQECAILKSTYLKYKGMGKINYVLIDTDDDKDTALALVRDTRWYGEIADDFYLVCDNYADKIFGHVAGTGVPRNVFIDSGGYVFDITPGLTEGWLERIIYLNSFNMPKEDEEKEAEPKEVAFLNKRTVLGGGE